jgi:hypothetical protein
LKQFLLLLFIYISLLVISDKLLISDGIYYDQFEEQFSVDLIEEVISESGKWKWFTYVFFLILILIKIFLVSACFSAGSFATGIDKGFKDFVRVSIRAEFLFLIPGVIKLFWFSVVKIDFTLQELQYFSPLSIFSLFNSEEIDSIVAYPLQLLNLFELAYWCVLAWQLKDILNRDFVGSLGFVASTYGVGLLLWVIFVMFLTVSLT